MNARRNWFAMQALPIGEGTIKTGRKNWANLYLTLDVRLKEFPSEQGQDFISFILAYPVPGGEASN